MVNVIVIQFLDDKVDFCKVAEGLGCKAIRVSTKEEVAPAIKEALDTNGPVFNWSNDW